jgi:hypothetical protein
MARKLIDVGLKGNDGTGDSLRDSFRKINDNFQELYGVVGLGDALTFIGLIDTPSTYVGNDNAVVSVNPAGTAIAFKQLVGGSGVTFDFATNPNEIIVNAAFSNIQSDESPQFGGPVNAYSGGERYPIGGLPNLSSEAEVDDAIAKLTTRFSADQQAYNPSRLAVNKGYADSKLSLAGTDAINTATGIVDPLQGLMTGPLILSRDPVADDDTGPFAGRIAATKRYVDNSSYYSRVNLYVSTSGVDAREDVSKEQQGRALAYSYRSIEAAAKRAEEIILEAPLELGPYKKKLTYTDNDVVYPCTLTSIVTSPLSGAGCTASARMSLDTITINDAGQGYLPQDVLSLVGGTGSQVTIRVITSQPGTGEILTFEILTTGNYSVIPGSTNISTLTTSQFGVGATFDLTYKVTSIVVNTAGSGYDLVSVRISGGGGSGAFASADVVSGQVTSVSVTAQGSGYTSIPTVIVDLPRFKIFTDGIKTDFTLAAGPSRDIREGLYLRGLTSGALANILSHSGALDLLDELFEVEIVSGAFEIGEEIEYGDAVKQTNITIIIESGTYQENFPIKVPANVSIAGDEFRRTIIRPRAGISTSPWVGVHFCRDTVLDGLTIATQRFGRHYLTDSTEPIYPLINNAGGYTSAARVLESNRNFIKLEVIGWIEAQISAGISPYTTSFEYNRNLCARDAGLLIDSMIFDLKYGGQNRTVSAALKYYLGVTDLGNSLIAITEQKAQTIAAINYLNTVAQAVLDGVPPSAVFQTIEDQVIDPGVVPEAGSDAIFTAMINIVTDIVDDVANFNSPKNNDELDVYLMNDATRLYQQTIQGAGGFALVLDPEGQILTKSPYAQVGTVFAKSINKQIFTGSLFIDGFAGNQQFSLISKTDNFNLNVGELVRKPQTPFTFFRNGDAFRVNFIRNFQFSTTGSTATFVMDESTPYEFDLFTYNESKCFRDTGLIIDAVLSDLVFGTNYQSTKAGQAYRRAYSSEVIDTQIFETIQGINYARDQVLSLVTDPAARSIITSRFLVVTNILSRGTAATPVLLYPNTVNAVSGVYNASVLLQANKTFLKAEIVAWINNEIADGPGSSGNVIWNGFTYNSETCARDVGYLVDAFTFDLLYGGNLSTVDSANSYWYNNVSVFVGQTAQSAAAYTRLKAVIQDVVQSITVTPTTGNTETQIEDLVNNGSSTAATTLGTLSDIIIAAVTSQASIPGSSTPPTYTNSTNTLYKAVRLTVQSSKATIQQATIDYINDVISKFELITPGNRSMLSNDFTSINDMGYGLLATNGGLTEAVSMFTYYCYTAYYALNGGQIRSIGGSSANGVYALKAEGSDPLEIPDIVFLMDNVSQGATVYAPGGLSPYQSAIRGLTLYAEYDSYVPYNQSEIEIDHAGVIVRYLITSADTGGSIPAGVVKLNISTTGAGNTSTAGLVAAVADGTRITIRSVFTFKLDDVTAIVQTRPSTALVFIENTDKVYRVLSLNSAGLPAGQARMTLRENYDFIDALIFNTGDPLNPQPADHGEVGDSQVAVNNLATQDAIRAVGSQFCWKGTLHTITAYETSDQLSEAYARIKFSPALVDSLTGYEDQVTIRAGAQAGMSGDITAAISTARFTGHDLLDIGTGSYADTNYPDVIYGLPANPKDPQKEVQEVGKGRVFFVSTDQDGNFRVGDLFRVDQGTGTVTFAAAIALSSLDGLGFKRGVQIAEFSTDDTFSDNATDTVPVEQAVRAYIDRRLGLNHNGGILDDTNLIPDVNGGYMALNGDLPMKSDMDLGSFKIINMEDPINALDAVNKRWHTLGNLQDAAITGPVADASFLTFTGAGTSTVNAALTGDVTVTRSGNTLTSAITAGSIVNADINASAAIAQTKLALNDSTAAATSGAAVKGIASFDSANFETASGWVGIKANGVALTEIAQIAGRSVVANNGIAAGNVTAVLMTDVINNGGAVKKSQFSAVGYLRRNSLGDFGQDTSYEIINDATGNTANTLVRRDVNGDFAARIANFQSLSIDSKIVIDTELLSEPNDAGIIKLYSYNGVEAITLGSGNLATDKKNFYRNDEHVFQTQNGLGPGIVNTGTLTTGGAATAGTITGNWLVSAGSVLDASAGSLKSTSLTTGAEATTGTITGTWTLGGISSLTLDTGFIDARTGTLYSDTLHAGSGSATGSITGQWSVAAGSALVASSVQSQANSATITAATANTANTIVLRDANGDFSARNVTATNFLGNATTATSAGQWTTTRTISLTGDVTGSANINGTGDISITTTIGGNQVALGTDTTGAYARSISVSGTGISITTGSLDDGTDYTITSTATSANTINAIVQRDGSGNFTAGTITAALTGNASTASTATNISVTNTTTNQSYYMLFVDDSASGARAARTEADIVYNPGTNTLTIGSGAGTVSANLSGNATTATTATALNNSGNYRVNSFGVGTDGSGTTGEIRATNNITAYYSDDRLKTKLGKIENALDKVDQLNGFYYEANQTAQDLGYEVKREVGVSAQEVEAIMPEIVAPAPIDDKYLTVRYEKLAPLLIEAIKELRAEINDIKKKLG